MFAAVGISKATGMTINKGRRNAVSGFQRPQVAYGTGLQPTSHVQQKSACACGGVCPRCRGGEGNAPPGNSVAIGAALADIKGKAFMAAPVADTMKGILARTGNNPGLLGFTQLDSSSQLMCNAAFTVNKDAGNCSVKVDPISLKINSFYVSPGLHDTGLMGKPKECPAKQVPIKFRISKAVSAAAKAAEQEHCDDLTLAYQRTLEPCWQGLQSLHGKTVAGNGEATCRQNLVKQLGYDPLVCTEEFLSLAGKTGERDDKDWHAFDPVRISGDCNQVIYELKKSATNKIGDASVAPEKFIPNAGKCGPAAAPPSPTPPPKPAPQAPPSAPVPEKPAPRRNSNDQAPP